MDKNKCISIRAALATALASVEKEFNIKLNLGSGSYNERMYKVAVTFDEVNADGTSETQEAASFKLFAENYGLKASDLNREFILGGVKYKIEGLNSRAYVAPIIASSNGKKYKFKANSPFQWV